MKMSSKARRARRAVWSATALGLVRPGAEAVLLAGVAIGCAQLVWRIAVPENLDPVINASRENAEPQEAIAVAFRSPFAPLVESAAMPDHAELSAIRLAGVRVSTQPSHSGAILTLADGAQRPFLVGYEVMDGVRLASVAADHIVLSYESGEQIVSLDRPDRSEAPVFALAHPPAISQQAAAAPAWPQGSAAAVSMNMSETQQISAVSMLAAGARVEMRNGAPYGWRIATPPPVLAGGGLMAGDLVVSVNGAGPRDPAGLVAAASRRPLEVVVERAGGQRVSLQFLDGLPS